MAPSTFLLSSVGLTLLTLGVYNVAKFLYRRSTSPLHQLPGPANPSWVSGNLRDIFNADPLALHEQWVEEFGPTLKYAGYLNAATLLTMDTKALGHILSRTDIYQKSEPMKYDLGRILGAGLLIVEDDQHKLQRKIMNPAFGPAQVRALTEIFVTKAIQLRDLWTSIIEKDAGTSEKTPEAVQQSRVDVMSGLGRMTLDVIGIAGFGYDFGALADKENELSRAFSRMFTQEGMSILGMLQLFVPILRCIPTARSRVVDSARGTMNRIGQKLLADAKARFVLSEKDGVVQAEKSRDLLSLLVRANTSNNGQALSDDDVLAQVPTFFIAGHETSSTAVTWALYQLALCPDVQTKLRAELRGVSTDTPDMDELNQLPYFDKVVRETMRVHSPVTSTFRVPVKDDFIPLSKPFVDRNGVQRNGIHIAKGNGVIIPILSINRSKELWGEDALEFKPDRWDNLPESVTSIPSVWAHQLTFIAGPRACIGYRFSLVEIKALLFTLVRAFEFEPAVPASDITKKTTITQRPILRSEPEKGGQMPLFIRLARDD
ncbi:hypothetical protein PLICRDRAFT_51689 [Plicaturopsis crispa FD-325 SS-3]|nr:hypothetical protein PLICRDRAFT_51689 [Plicaturopsis crispa FD-325 SS-3]